MNWCQDFGANASALSFQRQHVVLQKPANFSAAVEIAELKEAVSATEPRIAAITENYLKILLPNYRCGLPIIFSLDLTDERVIFY